MGHDHRAPRVERLGMPVARQVVDAWGDLALDMADAMESFLAGVAAPRTSQTTRGRPHRSARHRGRRCCDSCGDRPDRSCACECCIPDADLLVVGRAGERRVVPVLVRNERRRERELTVELSTFTRVGGGDAAVAGEIVGEREFTLGACDSREVLLVLHLNPPRGQEAGTSQAEGRVWGDVESCVVSLADLRLTGCESRPVRIAVAVRPRSCDRYETSCGCGCC